MSVREYSSMHTPTFRGNAGQQNKSERTIGETWIDELAKNPDYLVIKSLHPHMLKRGESQPLTTGELLFSADLLITDYSSVLFEYLLRDSHMAGYFHKTGSKEHGKKSR